MSRINLDGGEIGIIRALGYSGAAMPGCELKGRVGRMSDDDLAESLKTMATLGYISATPDLNDVKDLDSTTFAVNTGYAKALQEAIDPPKEPVKRVRRV